MKPVQDYANAAALLWCRGTTLHEACAQVMAEMLRDVARHSVAIVPMELGAALRLELRTIAEGGDPTRSYLALYRGRGTALNHGGVDIPKELTDAIDQGDGHA